MADCGYKENDTKKIVYVSNANIPSESASSVHVMKMCEALGQNDLDITLMIPNHFNKQKYRDTDVFEYYGVTDRFRIKRIKFIQKNVKGIREILYSISAVLYTKFIKRPDLMMTRKIMAARIAAMIGMPYVLELHTGTEPRHYSLSKTLHSKHMKRLVVISESLKKYMAEKYQLPEELIMVLPDAVDLSEYEALDTSLKMNEEKLKVAYVGSLYPGKGMETILRLAAMDQKNQYDVYGGRGPLEQWKQLKEEIHSHVNFMGQIENAKVAQTLIQYDVVLMPYSNKVEVYGEDLTNYMSPLKMFEYMASGRVIVSSDLPVIREILTDGKDAYLVEPDNVKAWYAAIQRILTNPREAEQMAENARQKVQEYTWRKRACRIKEMMEKEWKKYR